MPHTDLQLNVQTPVPRFTALLPENLLVLSSVQAINEILALQKITTSQIITSLIQEHLRSPNFKIQDISTHYYKNIHKISKKLRFYFDESNRKQTDGTKINNINVTNHFALQVDQKVNFLISLNPSVILNEPDKITVVDNDDPRAIRIDDYFNNDYFDIIRKLAKGASIRGREYLLTFVEPFINESGQDDLKFSQEVIESTEVIPIYDRDFPDRLVEAIRHYHIDVFSAKGRSQRIVAHWYKRDHVEYYIQDEKGQFILDPDRFPNPSPYLFSGTRNEAGEITIENVESWHKLPMLELRNNSDFETDLERIKTLQDSFNWVDSGFLDNVDDVAEVIMVIKNAMASKPHEVANNLRYHKLVLTSGEGNSAGVDAVEIHVPVEARDNILTRLKESIYAVGRAVDPTTDSFGNAPSGEALKFLYQPLDDKSNELGSSVMKVLKDSGIMYAKFLDFMGLEGVYDPSGLVFDFNKSTIFNVKESAEIAQISKGIIDDQSILENHPWVKDAQKSMERLEEQRNEALLRFESLQSDDDDNDDDNE